MTIYDKIGGKAGVAAAVDIFYAHVLADGELAPYFTSTDMRRQKAHLRAFLGAAIGGPEAYAGRSMAAAHAGRHISVEAFDRVVDHLTETLAELDVAPD